MISRLSIQGLAIIDSLTIEFSPGFNVITGETGAGKSILIRALNFLLGGKVTPEVIRKGSPHAMVTGEFTVPEDHAAMHVLRELGIPADGLPDNGGYSILVRRQLTAKGRSQSWVNDVVVTSQPLRELGGRLVDIFAQHENQRLMNPGAHTSYVDSFLKDGGVLTRVTELSRECQRSIDELSELITAYHSREKSRDYLSFRRDELKQFSPSVEDYEKVQTFCQQADTMVASRDKLARALTLIEGGEEGAGPAKALREASRGLSDPELSGLKDKALSLASEIDDVSFEIARRLSGVEVSDEDLEEAQARLFGYQDLFRKHAVKDVASLVAEADRLKEELAFLESAETKLEEVLGLLERGVRELYVAAEKLTSSRKSASGVIKKRVESELHELAMPGSIFEVQFEAYARSVPALDFSAFQGELPQRWDSTAQVLGSIGEGGKEKAQFLLASNPGEPVLPLSRVASGGEISRIMLAFKKALAADAETCVLVFDEIDTGISGRVADVVGKKMRELSEAFQIICISHLPQVAVYADTHFLVTKGGKGERTESSIVRMSRQESAKEIARLLSGEEVSKPSLQNALNLMEKARSKKTPRLEKRPG